MNTRLLQAVRGDCDVRGFVGCVRPYCYCRERKYRRHDDPNDASYVIKVKEGAPELLHKALSRLSADLVTVPTAATNSRMRKSSSSRAACRRSASAWAFRCRCWSARRWCCATSTCPTSGLTLPFATEEVQVYNLDVVEPVLEETLCQLF